MNPLARGVHKNLDSKSYHRMQNEFEAAARETQQVQGRLRLGGRRKKAVPEQSRSTPQLNGTIRGDESGMDRSGHLLHQSWTGEFPSEFSSRHEPMQRRLMTDAESVVSRIGDESLVSHGEVTDVAVRPTISKPSPQHIDRHAQRGGAATIISTNSLESMDRVEKASITSPKIHANQWNRNRMSKQRMLSEKTINTINTQGTMNTNTTAGTGTHTATTADSTLRSSITSVHSLGASAMMASTSEFSAVSPYASKPSLRGRSGNNSFRRSPGNNSNDGSMTLSHVRLPRHQKPYRQDTQDRSTSDDTASPLNMSPDVDETEEDRMMRLAMEMSLRDFEEHQQLGAREASSSSGRRQAMASASSGKQQQMHDKASPRPTYSQPHQSTVMQSPSLAEEQDLRRRLHHFDRQSSQQSLLTTATKEELTEVLVENHRGLQRNRRSSRMLALAGSLEKPRVSKTLNTASRAHGNGVDMVTDPSVLRQMEFARAHLSKDEADAIELALLGEIAVRSVPETTSSSPTYVATPEEPSREHLHHLASAGHLSETEAAEIEKAIREADEEEQRRSINLVMHVSAEEARTNGASGFGASHEESSPTHATHALNQGDGRKACQPINEADHGRIRSNMSQENMDQFVYVNDVDFEDEETGEELFAIEADEDIVFVGNTVYDAFKQSSDRHTSVSKESTVVPRNASEEVPSAEARLRNQVSSAVRTGLIEQCNGIVKQGEEADIYHANQGAGSDGHDVAIKVFQRMKGSKIRSMMGDPRYYPRSSRSNISCSREELILRAEREFRNLIRANRARVPVASPLLQKENLVFMRFIGEDGWPAPQLKDLELRKGSKGWCLLYSQIMVAVRRLYMTARLVHADLNECNILVCPSNLVEHKDEGVSLTDDGEHFQAVLIDFVQSVDVNHPNASELLERDLEQIRTFFFKKGIKTLGRKMAIEFVTAPEPVPCERFEAFDDDSVVDEKVHKAHNVELLKHGRQVAASAVEPVLATTLTMTNSHSTTLIPPSVSTTAGGDSATVSRLSHSARTISANSYSTRSSLSSTSSAYHSTGLKQPCRGLGVQISAASAVSGRNKESSGGKVSKKEKKEKKHHKEKKEKKKKKDSNKESSSGKRKTKDSQQEPEQAMMEQSLFPIGGEQSLFPTSGEQSLFPIGVESPTALFSDSLDEFASAFGSDKFGWHAEWDDDVLEG